MRPRPTSTDGGHRAANRVVDILELLAVSRDGLALREVSARLGAPKSSLLPLLRALTARGYLAQGRALEYRLGPSVLDLGSAAPAHRDLVEVARPAVVDLMRRTGETVFLGTLCSDRASIVYVDKVESDHVIRYAGGVGDRRPLHATSSGKVILAFLSPDEREQVLKSLSLARHTERTVTSLPAPPRLARDDPARRGLRDHRRAGAGCVRDRGARLRSLRPRRRCVCDRRAHGSGWPQGQNARHRGDGHRANSLGGARTPPER